MVCFAVGVSSLCLNFICDLVSEGAEVTHPSAGVVDAGGARCAPAAALSRRRPSRASASLPLSLSEFMATSASAACAGTASAMATSASGTSRERREREALAATGRRESRERRPRVKEPPSGDYLREILFRQEPSNGAAVDATGESFEMYGRPCSAGGFENSCPQSLTEVASSGDRSRCNTPSRQSSAATPMALPSEMAGSTASVPSMLAPALCSPEDAETQRRRTLFEIQRLMLEARPYDSIEFFHVQRELVKYLGLEPQRRASIADYLLAPGPPEGTMPTHTPQQSNTPQSSSASNKRNETKNEGGNRGGMTASKSFWKRLRSRLRLGSSSSTVGRVSATTASTVNSVADGTNANAVATACPSKGDGDVVQEV